MLSQNFLKNSFPDLTTATWRTWLDYHITYFIWHLTWITTHMSVSFQLHYGPRKYQMNTPSKFWRSHRGFEDRSLSVWPGYKFFAKSLIFCNALLCIQTLVTYYCLAKELLSLCKTTYSLVCAFQYLLFPKV